MKNVNLMIGILCLSNALFAQKGKFEIGVKINPSVNVATVNDNDGTTSKIKYITSMVGVPMNDVVLFVDGVYMTPSRD